jgi:hypothetical protein
VAERGEIRGNRAELRGSDRALVGDEGCADPGEVWPAARRDVPRRRDLSPVERELLLARFAHWGGVGKLRRGGADVSRLAGDGVLQ